MAEMERGRLRRIFGKVAACVAVAATFAFYALGFQIGHAYYQDWQQNKAEVTATWQQPSQHKDYTSNLPWAEAGIALVGAYGVGAAAIAAGKRKDRGYGGYSSSGYSSSSSNDGFFWGYMWGSSSGRSSGGSSSGSSKDNGGAAAAVVIIGAVALAAGASVVSYKAVKANFFTGEKPLNDKYEWKRGSLEEISARNSKPIAANHSEPVVKEVIKEVVVPPAPPPSEPTEPSLGTRKKGFQL